MAVVPKKLLDSNNDDVVIVAGTDFDIVFTLTKNGGSTLDVTGGTVTCSIRAEGRNSNVISDHAVAITTAASGIVTLSILDTESSALISPSLGSPLDTVLHLADVKLLEADLNIRNFGPFSFGVRRPIT